MPSPSPAPPYLQFLEPPSCEAVIISFFIIKTSGRVSSWQRGVQEENFSTKSLSLVDSEASGITTAAPCVTRSGCGYQVALVVWPQRWREQLANEQSQTHRSVTEECRDRGHSFCEDDQRGHIQCQADSPTEGQVSTRLDSAVHPGD